MKQKKKNEAKFNLKFKNIDHYVQSKQIILKIEEWKDCVKVKMYILKLNV